MKLSDEPKKLEGADEGNYNEAQLEAMLEHFIEAKKIEADPKLLALLKDYARSKNKQIDSLLGDEPVKSLKDLKSKYNKKVMEDDDEDADDEE